MNMPNNKGKQRATTRSKRQLAKEQNELVTEAFRLFSLNGIENYEDEEHGVLKYGDVRRVLTALEVEVEDFSDLKEELDPNNEGWVLYNVFSAYALPRLFHGQTEVNEQDHIEEVEKAYSLFTRGGPGPISIAHLRSVARQLKEQVTDEQLVNMIKVANGREDKNGWQAGVNMTEFDRILGAAGVWKHQTSD